ncbi:Sua5/YciO/YrdC/YwlC family protein [Mycoplasmopsis agassizii]|uniref:Sua5/YciO/YrdC/YwlC family protein n=1 Tax=Mycoplasmopsis agassizii TaxID=33922 RepID=UPI003526E450
MIETEPRLVTENEIVAFSTDTVNGIAISAKNRLNEIHLSRLKKRDLNKKIIILVSSIEQAKKFPEWDENAEKYARINWPGNVSLIVNNQGFRMPKQKKLLEFLELNGPFFATSANISDEPIIENLEEIKKVFPEIKSVFNFGKTSNHPSKIIDVNSNKILRD